ncbi:MAG: hypothetical protein AB8H86_22150 [Polyangiales bacterium]
MKHIVFLLIGLAACLPETEPADRCLPIADERSWENSLRSRGITLLGEPVHAGVDIIAAVGEVTLLEAKFAYGPTSADLEGERVAVFVETAECEWASVGEHLTDTDGRVHAEFDSAGLAEGSYRVRFVVLGDLSETEARLHVIRPSAPIVVFDLDGTLTTSDVELVDGIVLHHVGATSDEIYDLAGSPLTRAQWVGALDMLLEEDAEAYEGAASVVHYYDQLGVQPIYITGRPYLYDGLTRRWLEDHALPAGPLVMVQDVLESLPANVGGFKTRLLGQLQARGHTIVAAYGNATTDVCAYEAAGVPAESTFIVGPHAGEGCVTSTNTPTVAVNSYVEHLESLR